MTALIIWAALVVVLGVLEAATTALLCIWFALGALAAFLVTLFGGGVTAQIVAFLAVSVLSLLLTRPAVKRYLSVKPVKTNADSLEGQTAVVTEEINNEDERGRVKVSGLSWRAVTELEEVVPVGEKVKVLRISGAKLIVERVYEQAEATV